MAAHAGDFGRRRGGSRGLWREGETSSRASPLSAPALAAAREAKWRRFRRPLYTGSHSPLSPSSTRCLLFHLPRERPAVSCGAWRRRRRPPAGCGLGHRHRGSSPRPRFGCCWDSVAAVFLFFFVRICFVFFPICILYFQICLLSVVWTPSQGEIDPQSSFLWCFLKFLGFLVRCCS